MALDEKEDKIIFSEKDAWNEKQSDVISKYKVGTNVEGTITAITDFGVFISFGESLEGLIHISELAWQRIDNPTDLYKVGDKIDAQVISLENSKIFLSAKKLLKDPWENVGEKYKVGQVVKGKILKVNPFGLFVELDEDIHGLAHISQLGLAPKQRVTEKFNANEDGEFEIRYGALISIWMIVLITAGLMSSRFIALLAAPFAIAFGAAFGIIWKHAKKIKSNDLMIIGRVALVIIIGLLFISPISQAHKVALQEVPSMNDAWYNSLISIHNNTEDGIITSWWDFGHWFVNIAEQRVTFDGGGQGKRIYWVGKSLMTEDLEENKAILRMLNCGQNKGYERLLEYTGNNYKASELINEIIYYDKENASAKLIEVGLSSEEIELVLEKTHCSNEDLLDQYYIVSQDMIGKAAVWAHFGGWNFDRAYIYNVAKKQPYDKAMKIIQSELNLSEEQAAQLYFEANSITNNREVDSWISPWPSYITSDAKPCQDNNITIICSMGQSLGNQQGAQIILDKIGVNKENPNNMTMNIITIQNGVVIGESLAMPAVLTMGDENGWTTYDIKGENFPYEIVIGKTASGEYKAIAAERAIADSTFSKLFFFDGLGMEGYEKISDLTSFRGERIIVYKVDLAN
jgi:predicted RNA-binding protein with RPS1 domain